MTAKIAGLKVIEKLAPKFADEFYVVKRGEDLSRKMLPDSKEWLVRTSAQESRILLPRAFHQNLDGAQKWIEEQPKEFNEFILHPIPESKKQFFGAFLLTDEKLYVEFKDISKDRVYTREAPILASFEYNLANAQVETAGKWKAIPRSVLQQILEATKGLALGKAWGIFTFYILQGKLKICDYRPDDLNKLKE